MNLPGSLQVLYLTLILDWIGICHFSWLLGYIFRKFVCCLKTSSDHKQDTEEVTAKVVPEKLALESNDSQSDKADLIFMSDIHAWVYVDSNLLNEASKLSLNPEKP